MSEEVHTSDSTGERGSGGLLSHAGDVAQTKREQEDIRLVSRAVRHGWKVPVDRRPAIVERLVGLVERTSVTVSTMAGPVEDQSRADSNAIQAAKVLVDMDGKDQTDFWNQDKNDRLDAGKMTENNGFMPAIIERPVRTTG